MRKIPTIFERDWHGDRSRVLDQPHPDCAWVFAGEGVATQKYDGSCCLISGVGPNKRLYKRRELRPGEPEPPGFQPTGTDPETGKTSGWLPVGDGREDRWHREAFEPSEHMGEGTCELVGPKIQGNPERYDRHMLIRHDHAERLDAPRDFAGLARFLAEHDVEGIVWHHPGRPDGEDQGPRLRDQAGRGVIVRLVRAIERRVGGRSCRVCGCTEHAACAGGCWWVERDLCSVCALGDDEDMFDAVDPDDWFAWTA